MSGRPAEGAKGPIILEEGVGAWVTDVEGNRYLDALSGQWCVNVGYGRERLADAAAEQLKRLAFHPLTRGHVPAIELGERLDALLGGDRATFYSNSGSEANELAFKLVRQYHQLRGDHQRFRSSRATAPTTARRSARCPPPARRCAAAATSRSLPASSTSRRPTRTATGSPPTTSTPTAAAAPPSSSARSSSSCPRRSPR
jgi:hypothetical protein